MCNLSSRAKSQDAMEHAFAGTIEKDEAELQKRPRRERLFVLAFCERDELADPARLLWHPVERHENSSPKLHISSN